MFSAATKSGKNATGGAVVTDPQFPLVTSLIHGDGTSGQTNNTFLDSSTNNFTITRNGNTTQGTYTAYNSNWSNLFGTNNYVSFAMSQAFTSTTNFCVEAWLFPNTSTPNEYYWFETVQSGLFFDSSLLPNNTIFIRIGASTGATLTSTGTVTINTWNHVAITYNGTTLRVFINGVASGSVAFTMFTATTTQCIIGYNNYAPAPRYFDGYISNWQMSVGTARYTTAFTPSTTPFVPDAFTVLLTAQSPNFVDTSNRANVITLTGTPSIQRFSPFSPVTQTPISYSGYFDGTGDYLTATGSTAFTLGTGDFTIECWFYTAVGTNNAMFQLSNTAGGFNTSYTNTIAIGLLSGKINLYGVSGTGITSTGASYATSTWTHVALVRSSGVTKLYINGSLDTTVGTAGSIADTTSYTMQYIVVGGYYSTAYLWNGYVSNLRIVKGTAVYTSNFPVPTTPLTAISGTSFLTCQSTTFIDNSTNAFAIAVNGDSTPRKQNPFGATTATNAAYSTSANGGSMYFDGTGDYLTAPANTALSLGAGDFTIEFWIYQQGTQTTTYGYGIIGTYDGASNTGWSITINRATGSYGIYFIASGAAQQGYTASYIPLNTWTHIAVVRSGSSTNNLKTYLNGVQVATSTYTTNDALSAICYIGSQGIGSYFNGYISNPRYVKGTAVYTSNFVPPQSPVTAITNTSLLLNGTNAGVLDNAMMGDYETVGTTRLVTTIKKFGTSSVIFNGTTDYFVTKSNQAYAFNAGNFTVEMWLYPTSFTSYKSLYGNSTSAANATGFHTGLNASGNVFIYSASAFRLTTSNAMTLNAWNYVAIVRSGSTITVYINGTSGGTWTLTTQTFTDGQCFFGVAPGFGSEFYTGYLDDFRITKGFARTVTSLPTAAFPNS